MQPTAPVELTVPVPSGVTPSQTSLWSLESDGEWSTPIGPTSTTATSATFQVTHFSTYGLSHDLAETDTAALGEVVVNAPAGSTAEVPTPMGPTTVPLVAGSLLPTGTRLHVGPGGATMVDPQGNLLTFRDSTEATLAHCVDVNLCFPGAADVTVKSGGVIVVDNPRLITAKPKLRIQTDPRLWTAGPRGTMFEFDLIDCPSSTRAVGQIAVYEGTVDVGHDGVEQVVGAGQQYSLCSTCAMTQAPTCGGCLGVAGAQHQWVGQPTADTQPLIECDQYYYDMPDGPPGLTEHNNQYCTIEFVGFSVTEDGLRLYAPAGRVISGHFDPVTCHGEYSETWSPGPYTQQSTRASVTFSPDFTYVMSSEFHTTEYTAQGELYTVNNFDVYRATGTYQAY